MVEGEDQVVFAGGQGEFGEEAGVVVAAWPGDQGAVRVEVSDRGTQVAQVVVPKRVQGALGFGERLEEDTRSVVFDGIRELAGAGEQPPVDRHVIP